MWVGAKGLRGGGHSTAGRSWIGGGYLPERAPRYPEMLQDKQAPLAPAVKGARPRRRPGAGEEERHQRRQERPWQEERSRAGAGGVKVGW